MGDEWKERGCFVPDFLLEFSSDLGAKMASRATASYGLWEKGKQSGKYKDGWFCP